MHRASGLAIAFLMSIALGACGAGERGRGPLQATVDTVGGVERLLYPGHGGRALRWKADTVAVIGGALVDDDAYQFDQVTAEGLASDGAGRLHVLDRAGRRVLVYDAEGRHVATHGRPGGGPGEIAAPSALAVGPGDSIWVADIGNRRYTIFPPTAGEARSVPFPEEAGFAVGVLAIDDGGPVQAFRAAPRPDGPNPEPPRTILRLAGDGAILDTIWTTAPPQVDEVQSGNPAQRQIVVIRMPRAFEMPQLWQRFASGGFVVADTAEYVLRLIDDNGNEVRRIARDLPARQTTEADKELARKRLREQFRRGGGIRITIRDGGPGGPAGPPPEHLLQAQLNAMTFAPVIPRITGIRVDPHDRIWVGVSIDEAGTTERIDIYDRNGTLLGELTGWPLPDAFLGTDRAAFLTRDDMDVQQIVLVRIVEAAA
ncbi:MAG TPA: hypothetical protein VIL13_10255 [Longimicrobiales bacterium]